MAGEILGYTFATATVEPPSNKQLRLNHTSYALATRIFADNDTTDNLNIHDDVLGLPIGTAFGLDDAAGPTKVRFTLNAAPIDHTTYVELPVTFVSLDGTPFPNNRAIYWLIYVDFTPGPDIFLPPLVSLETAKMHLRITDTAHDADVQLKLSQAQDAIIDYLAEVVDMTWTEITVPKIVVAAILLYLAHLYENRGENLREPDEAVWDAIRRLLARLRMQAVGVGLESPTP